MVWVTDRDGIRHGLAVDKIAFMNGMTDDSPIHGSAMLQMNSGKIQSGAPCLGSWVTYGLGTENENLPAFVVDPISVDELADKIREIWDDQALAAAHDVIDDV